MELREYLKIISKRMWLLIVVVIVVTLATAIITLRLPASYDASTYINATVKNDNQNETSFYQYDNYYSIQASGLFASTIGSWLQDPSSVIEIYAKADIDVKDKSLKKLSKMISARTKQPATIVVNLNYSDREKADRLIHSVVTFVQNRTNAWANEGLVKNAQAVSSTPVVIEHQPSLLINTLVGFAVSLVLGLALLFFAEYMSEDRKR